MIKHVLITGESSYIGNSFYDYISDYYKEQESGEIQIEISKVSVRKDEWKRIDFGKFDSVVHVAGKAHVDVVDKSNKDYKKIRDEYYAVNRDLTYHLAKKAKEEGVTQFVFLSSIIVYGESAPIGIDKRIDGNTKPSPVNYYGKSKYQAEQLLHKLDSDDFKVAILRLPMIYGDDCKGNFRQLQRIATISPIFPNIINHRSALYIKNLCELLRLMIIQQAQGLYFPQDREYLSTSNVVKTIGKFNQKNKRLTRLLNPFLLGCSKMPGKLGVITNKAFGNLIYEKRISTYTGGDYQIYDFKSSIRDMYCNTEHHKSIDGKQNEYRNNENFNMRKNECTGKLLVSVVTVSYNSEKTIRTTIESVLNQTYSNYEYFIIDGQSKDRTIEIAKEYEEKFEQKGISYTIVSEKDGGIYDAMNKGIRMAHGDFIGIINSDDWYEKNAIQRMVETYHKTPFDMFYADVRIVRPQSSFVKHSKNRRLVVSRDWNHPTTFISKEVYQRFQYKLESIHDDWDLVLRIRKAGYRIVVLNEVLANFRFGGVSNEKSMKSSIQRGKARYRIYRNNGYSRLYWVECVLIEAVKYVMS